MIDTQAFREDITAVSAKLKELSDAGRAKTNDQEFMAALDEYNKIIKDMKACNAGWDDEYDFNPDVAFDYDEEYIDMLPNKELKFKQQDSKKSSESWYCHSRHAPTRQSSPHLRWCPQKRTYRPSYEPPAIRPS